MTDVTDNLASGGDDPRAAGATVERMTALLGTSGAINANVATCQNFALAMALAEAGAVDLSKVAAWAEFFGGLRSADVAPEIRGAIETALKAYAGALRSMATKPAGGWSMTRKWGLPHARGRMRSFRLNLRQNQRATPP